MHNMSAHQVLWYYQVPFDSLYYLYKFFWLKIDETADAMYLFDKENILDKF